MEDFSPISKQEAEKFENEEQLLEIGEQALSNGDWKKAECHFIKILQIDEKDKNFNQEIYPKLGFSILQQERYIEALKIYQENVSQNLEATAVESSKEVYQQMNQIESKKKKEKKEKKT